MVYLCRFFRFLGNQSCRNTWMNPTCWNTPRSRHSHLIPENDTRLRRDTRGRRQSNQPCNYSYMSPRYLCTVHSYCSYEYLSCIRSHQCIFSLLQQNPLYRYSCTSPGYLCMLLVGGSHAHHYMSTRQFLRKLFHFLWNLLCSDKSRGSFCTALVLLHCLNKENCCWGYHPCICTLRIEIHWRTPHVGNSCKLLHYLDLNKSSSLYMKVKKWPVKFSCSALSSIYIKWFNPRIVTRTPKGGWLIDVLSTQFIRLTYLAHIMNFLCTFNQA